MIIVCKSLDNPKFVSMGTYINRGALVKNLRVFKYQSLWLVKDEVIYLYRYVIDVEQPLNKLQDILGYMRLIRKKQNKLMDYSKSDYYVNRIYQSLDFNDASKIL